MKIAVAGIYHETNTFAPGFTSIDAFQAEWVSGNQAFFDRYEGTRTTMGGVCSRAKELNIVLIPGLYIAATPSGIVGKETAEALFEAVCNSLEEDVDGLFLIMHGAMVADSFLDVEGELLQRIRDRFGYDIPLAMTIDLHANISSQMVKLVDIIVGYDTYPHIDMFERAEEALGLLADTIEGRVKPMRALSKSRMLVVPQSMLTHEGVMKELMDEAFAMEKLPNVMNVTVAGGFPYSDVPDAGMAFVVTTNNDVKLADQLAQRIAHLAWEKKTKFQVTFMSPNEAVRKAIEQSAGPVILTEGSDNVGGGAPADATHLLALLKDTSVKTLIVIRDVEAALKAHEIGVGGEFDEKIGGKSDDLHGEPVPIKGKIRLLFDGVYNHVGPYMTGQRMEMGRTAVIESEKLTVVLTENRTPPWDLGHISSVGLWPEDYHIIVVKSAIAWQAAFGPYAQSVIHVDTPGCCTANLKNLSYNQVKRPIDPLDLL